MSKNHAQDLRRILAENKFLTLPGVYDCLSGKIAEEAGFPALFLSGGALAYSVLGRPDFGFLSLAEFGTAIQHIVSTCSAPLLADADNGFGNAIQAANTGAMYEQLGAAGLQIDDKVLPTSHPARDEIINWDLMSPKIQAVRDNVSPDFVIVFRTCANLYGYGIDEAASISPRSAVQITPMWMGSSLWRSWKRSLSKLRFPSWLISMRKALWAAMYPLSR